ncbi:hypothetical protein FS837_006845 [Tulasnella sp. UAMH 9824]|nr:hypothetical protein FS837_006845 [Tulasnella sp. UAMH 9824]
MSSNTQPKTKESRGVPYPDPSRSTVTTENRGVIVPILRPIIIFLVGALLALGHHFFNAYADGQSLDFMNVSQVWMNRIGTAFAVTFKSALSTSLSFVLCQLMWFTLRRKFMTFAEIDNVYLTADRDVLATFFSSSIFKSPLLVVTAALGFLLPLPAVLTPSSLQVVPHTSFDLANPCMVPTGNLTNGGPGSILYTTGGWGYWIGITPVAQKLATSTFVGQRIPTLPQPCGTNCTYSVSFPSIAFQCQEGVDVPAGMSGTFQGLLGTEAFWNVTTNSTYSSTPDTSFYVYWKSSTQNGTNGTALCTVGQAQYDFAIQITNGQQSVDYTVTQKGDLPPSGSDAAGLSPAELHYSQQLASLSVVTRSLLFGSISILHGASTNTPQFDSSIISAAFFDTSLNSGNDFTWGNVARGIEQLSHNVSAAILTMDLGVQDSRCAVSRQDIVYEYNRLNLWLPYGVALLVVALCLILGIMVFLRLNPENLTSSFSDTVGLTRNSSLNIFARQYDDVTESKRRSRMLRFRLGELKNGGTGFGMREDLKSE